jgi:hypothetical protein
MKVPGPGAYNTPRGLNMSSGTSFGKETRGMLKKNGVPGPGQYAP